MTHYFIKRYLAKSPVKRLCDQVWVSRPPGPLTLQAIDCPECLKILVVLQEKRLKLLQANLLKAVMPNEGLQ